MGRKRKRKLSSQDSRMYQFRPRNGLGLYFSKRNSKNASSIFEFNHRNVSPDSSLDNDEDVVGGILFTSFKELRGLENHSPLIINSVSSDEDYIEENNVLRDSNTLYENVSFKMFDSHYPMKRNTKPDRYFDADEFVDNPSFYTKLNIKRLESSQSIKRPRIDVDPTYTTISNSNLSKSKELSLVELVEMLPNSNNRRLPSKDIMNDASNSFLIKNLLKHNCSDNSTTALVRKFDSRPSVTGSYPECNRSEVKFQSFKSQVSPNVENNDETYISSGMHGYKYPSPLCVPFHSDTKKTSSQFSISSENLFPYSCNKYTEDSENVTSRKPHLPPTIPKHFEPISLQHEITNDSVSPTISTLAFTPHLYPSISPNINFPDRSTYFSHISGNSFVLAQQKYRVCMNHAYIAWSIFARETHLREEDSREKGLYPLSLHNKKCYSKPILRPKVIREFDCSRYQNSFINELYASNLSIETLSQLHTPCQLTRRDIGAYQPSFSYSLSTHQSNEISAPTIPNSITNRLYSRPTSLTFCPPTVYNNLNNIQHYPYSYSSIPNSEPSTIQCTVNNSSKYYSNCARSTKCFQDMKYLDFNSIIPVNLTKFLNPLLHSNIIVNDADNSHNNILKSNPPFYSHHSLEQNIRTFDFS